MKRDIGLNIALTLGFILALLIVIPLGCTNREDSVNSVVFMAGYKPQANLPFVAAYVAQEKGFFAAQNLDVEILHTSSGENIPLLMSGDVDVTTADATTVLKRISDPGLPIKAFALFGQRGQQAFITLSDAHVQSPKDWEGLTFGYKFTVPPDYLAILKTNQVDRSKINEVRVGFDPRILIERKVDILAVFKSNEPDTITKLGFEVDIWDPSDYDLPTLGLTYITTVDKIKEDPEILRRFLRATMKAVEFIQNNPEEALKIVMKYAPGEDIHHQRYMMMTELEDGRSPLTMINGFGSMTDRQWSDLYDQLLEFGTLTSQVDYKDAFVDDFIKSLYEGDKLIWP